MLTVVILILTTALVLNYAIPENYQFTIVYMIIFILITEYFMTKNAALPVSRYMKIALCYYPKA